ncbi:LLM class flavin-dependent oxidoreductase [Candidatus Bathyarchaeota archaeon]|nr:LLM class flavin-dependent oxidoreductase [Candidatus Bathyarchaeota archaeon]
MRFFLTGLGNLAENIDYIIDSVIQADKLGLHGALMPDHYMWGPEIGHRMENPYDTLEAWTTLTYLAGKTRNIKLGTLVSPLPFRHPGILAKRLSTLDIISNGRVVLGVGAGWSQVEFEGYSTWGGAKYRVDKTIEALQIITRLWTEEEVTFKSNIYSMNKAVLRPKPVQEPYPQLLFGSQGKRMLKLTGQYGNICFIPPWAEEKKDEIKKIVLKSAEEYNRVDKIEFMLGLMGSQKYDRDEILNKIEESIAFGATYFTVAFPRESTVESMKDFAKWILPNYT